MNINRHNYEEYFLLYMDNELPDEQRKQVELFVKENPDLEAELVMFQQSRLVPDDSIVFDQKHLLLKEGTGSFITMTNYEEWLVLYVDDELNDSERTEIEKFAAAHPQVQQELLLFQQTKLPSDKLVFAHKEALFRKTEKASIISMVWMRVAVAAVLIIAAGTVLYSVLNKNDKPGGAIAKTETSKEITPGAVKPANTEKKQDAVVPGIEVKDQMASTTSGNHKAASEIVIEHKKNEQENNSKPQLAENTLTPPVDQVAVNADKKVDNNINYTKIEESRMKNDVAIGDKSHKEIFNAASVTNSSVETPDNSNATGKDVQFASNTENKKLRGFFRKATRLIERTTNINPADDDNKVLIGGMAINLK